MKQSPKDKAKELFTHYHNLIQDIGGELGQEILVSILARHCALFAAREVLKENFEEWRAFRDKNNAYHKKRYDNRTPEQIEKNREYQRQKQKLYYWMKNNNNNESDKVPTTQPRRTSDH